MLRSGWNLRGESTGAGTVQRGTATAGRRVGRSGLALLTLFVQRTIPFTIKGQSTPYWPAIVPLIRPAGLAGWCTKPAIVDRRRARWTTDGSNVASNPPASDALRVTSMEDRASFGTVTYEEGRRVERLPSSRGHHRIASPNGAQDRSHPRA